MAEKTNSMIEDLVALQKALPVMPKDTSNPFFKSKYTSLDTITEIVFPIMTKHNFAWVTMPSFNEQGEPTMKYNLMHVSGTNIGGEMRLFPGKSDAQGQGSAITYARRYALTSVLGIVSDEDDDGNAARKAAEAAKVYNRDDFPPEESRDVNEDVVEELISDDALLKIAGEIKKHGIAAAPKVNKILDELAKEKGAAGAHALTVNQGRQLFMQIRESNKEELLSMLEAE